MHTGFTKITVRNEDGLSYHRVRTALAIFSGNYFCNESCIAYIAKCSVLILI